jgi:hypothetical protein
MNLSLQTTVQRSTDLNFEKLDGEMLAMDERAGYFYSMTPTAHRVWELLAQPMTLQALCAQLCQEFAVDEATCLGQVQRLLAQWLDAGLLSLPPEAK